MELDPGTVSIIQLAWSRLLGLDDDALAGGGPDRLYSLDDDASVLTFVTLFGQEVLKGPAWAIDAGRSMSGLELRSHSALLTLSRNHGGRGLGEAQLYFCDVLPQFDGPPAVVSREQLLVRALERRCPPDDVAEAGLGGAEHAFVLVAEGDDADNGQPTPLAGAGYDIWEGILAHTAVITPPDERRKGYAQRIAAVAVEEAMAAGLVPQWRARTDNTASQRTARRAGFAFAGTQTSVILDA
ncbi:GNAT family N-acetyltransferase [Arthrobacter sp. NamB2]|uniref:GNAT family N-acetyltransferase n=1 Tax=Arthrobacter sp. NamB2 TaxID=2576035 RepID=UPI0010C9A635|nr:GNAT family N-acetyltransferase [Arthrobacter sp. NamB2]TKV29448.1 GNAT family N-acetyltransferase [Arthrobacter sp. NamB2]